jgi:hypothetical protein
MFNQTRGVICAPVSMPSDNMMDLLIDHLIGCGSIRFKRRLASQTLSMRFSIGPALADPYARPALVDALSKSIGIHFVTPPSPPVGPVRPLVGGFGPRLGRLAVLLAASCSDLRSIDDARGKSSTPCVLLAETLDTLSDLERVVSDLASRNICVAGVVVVFPSGASFDAHKVQKLGLPVVLLISTAMAVDRAHHRGHLDAIDVDMARAIFTKAPTGRDDAALPCGIEKFIPSNK